MKWARNKFYQWADKKEIIKKYFVDNEYPLEYWNQGEWNSYIEETIAETIQHVIENNEYYREKLKKVGITDKESFSLEKFEKLSCLTKKELIDDPNLILSVPEDKIVQVFLSTGTTSDSVVYVKHTWEDLYIHDLAPEMPILFPISNKDIAAVALPYEMSSAGLSYHRVLQDGMGCAVISVGKGGAYSEPKKTVKALKDMKVNVLLTSPSYAMCLYECANENFLEIGKDINIKTIWLTGEGCSNAFRKRVEKLWKCSAYFYYGSLECGGIGIECEEQNGYHVCNGHVYVEILDSETGEKLEPGQIGNIVVTTLLKDGSPFIRYDTQDLGYIEEQCRCGIKLPKLILRGRKNDQIVINEKEYSPFYVEEQLMKIPEVGNNYQFLVYNNVLLIKTEINTEFENSRELEEKISSQVEFGCGIPNIVEITEKIGYTGKKAQRVVHINEDYPLGGEI